jgi:sterol desaturase/sphingolipid hydroxylase (fatty acid hydroxylase superfamily)
MRGAWPWSLAVLGGAVLFPDAFPVRAARDLLGSGSLWAFLGGVFVLEMLVPAKPGQRLFSVGFVQDFVWFVVWRSSQHFVVIHWLTLLRWAYDHTLWFLTADVAAGWPLAVQVVVAVLWTDLLAWGFHRTNHAVSWFWYFHEVHHSQRELNALTDRRNHVGEILVSHLLRFVPATIVGLSVPEVYVLSTVLHFHTLFVHANVRTDLGPLRYLVTTPQSHRIHHSIEARHRDRNFAVHFPLWDFLLGTQWTGWRDYPDTGVDGDFPVEEGYGGLVRTAWRQFAHPFRRVGRRVAGRRAALAPTRAALVESA